MILQAFFRKIPRKAKVTLYLALIPFILIITACQSTQYLWQAARGQWQILSERTPLKAVIENPESPEFTVKQLKFVEKVRQYAETQLHLPVEGAYGDYVDLKRPYVVWNLFVTPELDLTNQTWCYPVAGCVAYQGYFNHDAAKLAASEWQEKRFDTYIGGVAAYSTLGWFDDPVLNTFLFYDQISLMALLFHELAHRRLYVQNDTTFNESWATAVEQEAVEQFLREHPAHNPELESLTPQQIERYRTRFAERQVFVSLVKTAIEELRSLYARDLSASEKRQHKSEIISRLRSDYQKAVSQNQISNRYQGWFSSPINNAKLSTVASYHQWVPGLRNKLASFKGDWKAFYHWSEELAGKDPETRKNILTELNQIAEDNSMITAKMAKGG